VVYVYGNRRRKIKDFINRLEPILDPPVKPEDDEEREIQSCCFVEKINTAKKIFQCAKRWRVYNPPYTEVGRD
jgi:hypothetical protein